MASPKYFTKAGAGKLLPVNREVRKWRFFIITAVVEKNRNSFWQLLCKIFLQLKAGFPRFISMPERCSDKEDSCDPVFGAVFRKVFQQQRSAKRMRNYKKVIAAGCYFLRKLFRPSEIRRIFIGVNT
jgi:hypothetical protein